MKKRSIAIAVYAVGGSGINIARQVKDLDIQMTYIDTSASNTRGLDPHDAVFLLEDMDGAGKLRTADIYHRFVETIPKILLQQKPSESLNIVIAGLAGGSGSTGGPALAAELVRMGKNVIVVGLDSTSSVIELENSLQTLRSYRGLVSELKKPLSMFYVQNNNRREADKEALGFINLMATICDKTRTDEFDVADLTSFLNFDRVTANAPTLAMIEFSDNEELLPEKRTSIVGTIFVTKDRNVALKPMIPDYLATCVMTDPEFAEDELRINSVLGKSLILTEELESRIQTHKESRQIHAVKDLVVPSGMVF